MTDTVHVLVYGPGSGSAGDFYRLGMFVDRLSKLGVEIRNWSDFNDHSIDIPAEYSGRLADALRDGVAQIDRTPIDWADVILFRRRYSVAPCCEDCDTTGSAQFVAAHCQASGHRPNVPDRLAPLLMATFASHPESLRGRAMVYETDDDLLSAPAWLSFYNRLVPDRPIIESMLHRADLVTVATPPLARMAARFNDEVRVIRNAVDPAWYERDAAEESPEGMGGQLGPRIAYYGTATRLRDYEVCRGAVDALVGNTPGARRIWLGTEDANVRAVVDETHPYVDGVPAFARTLVGLRPDIGLAPVAGGDFERARSELRWLEYTLAGAATLASRTTAGGPYDVIRDGIDGVIARNRFEWVDGLRRLAGSRPLREELVGRARERVLTEYNADKRAEEWAAAFRWAAEHGGRGALPRRRAAGARVNPAAATAAAESRDNFLHRQRARRDAADATDRLAELRGDRDVCWPEGAVDEPLVSVVIPTYNRGRMVVERAINSVLDQTYQNFEIVVVGDCATPETVEAVLSAEDPRVVFENLPVRGPRPDDPDRAWLMSGSRPYNRGLDLARGQWIAPLSDDDEFPRDHIEVLLDAAIENRLEFVYGQAWMEEHDGLWYRVGVWPPRQGGITGCSMIYSAGLSFMKLDEECWREEEPNDWNLWRRMWDAGVRMGFLPQVVFRHYVEARHRLRAS